MTLTMPSSKTILLTRRQVVIVDSDDYEWLMQWKWCALRRSCSSGFYAVRTSHTEATKQVYMHRLILGLVPGDGKLADHISGDPLDNRRTNLRVTDSVGNCRNRAIATNNTTGYKGVVFYKRTGRWMAQIKHSNKTICLGYFSSASEASQAYRTAAAELFGDFARVTA